MPSSYQIVLWKQESFVVPRLRQIEFFRNLLGLHEFVEALYAQTAFVTVVPSGVPPMTYNVLPTTARVSR
jgi:hypothetical protein